MSRLDLLELMDICIGCNKPLELSENRSDCRFCKTTKPTVEDKIANLRANRKLKG